MKRLLAVLCVLALMLQPALLQGGPARAEEGVTTPSDIELVCAECAKDPNNIVLSWVKEGDWHVIACSHGVKLNNTSHLESYTYQAEEAVRVDEENHAFPCHGYDGCTITKSRPHSAACKDPSVCTVCGATDVAPTEDYLSLEHNWENYDNGIYEHDDTQHWVLCKDCGQEIHRMVHYALCFNPYECWECGATDVTFDYVQHDHNSMELPPYEHDGENHWRTCGGCGQKLNMGKHIVDCTTPDKCSVCDATVTTDNVQHSRGSYEHDADKHWYFCTNCGEKIEENHTVYCGETKCSRCYATDIDVSKADVFHETSWIIFRDGKNHWLQCAVCDKIYNVTPHIPAMKRPTICEECGGEIEQPTPTPTVAPTDKPTEQPTDAPTAKPTEQPTDAPTAKPTEQPTDKPTDKPTEQPTGKPTAKPTEQPTDKPTDKPTEQPTDKPTDKPTEQPTDKPTAKPTEQPTDKPTAKPTEQPTDKPTAKPTEQPTDKPAPIVTPKPEPAHEHSYDVAFVSNGDGTHSKTCLGGCGEVLTESCQLVTTDMGVMTCTACSMCGYAVYTAKESVATLAQGEDIPAVVVRVEKAAVAPADDNAEAVPADTVLVVHETTFEVPVALPAEVSGMVEKVFSAVLLKEGESIQPTGKVKLTIPVLEETLSSLEGKVLMLLRPDGTLVEIAYEVIDGELVFITDELGVFLLMQPEAAA